MTLELCGLMALLGLDGGDRRRHEQYNAAGKTTSTAVVTSVLKVLWNLQILKTISPCIASHYIIVLVMILVDDEQYVECVSIRLSSSHGMIHILWK